MTLAPANHRLNIVERGEGSDFVFQHGLCGDAAQTGEAFPEDTSFCLVTLECRGHGRSEAGDPADLSIAAFADDIAKMIEARHGAPVVLGGISMGAAIALRLAVTRPELVRALVLVRPAWVTEAGPSNMQAYAEIGELLATLPPDEARTRFEQSATARWLQREGPDNLASLLSFFSRQPASTTSELLARIARDGPGVTPREVEALRLPALVIGQARDPLHPIEYAERLAGMIANARFQRVTPKADSRERHIADLRAALGTFLSSLG